MIFPDTPRHRWQEHDTLWHFTFPNTSRSDLRFVECRGIRQSRKFHEIAHFTQCYALRSWPEKASWFLSISLHVEGCHCINSFSFVLRESCVLFFKKWRVNTRFSSLWLHDKPTFLWSQSCGSSPLQTRRFCCLITIIEDNSCRTRAWTWPSLVICNLFPVKHVQTLGGQASLETWDGLTLASRPWILLGCFECCL